MRIQWPHSHKGSCSRYFLVHYFPHKQSFINTKKLLVTKIYFTSKCFVAPYTQPIPLRQTKDQPLNPYGPKNECSHILHTPSGIQLGTSKEDLCTRFPCCPGQPVQGTDPSRCSFTQTNGITRFHPGPSLWSGWRVTKGDLHRTQMECP